MTDDSEVVPLFPDRPLPPTLMQEHAFSYGYNSTIGNDYKTCPWVSPSEFVPEIGVEVLVTFTFPRAIKGEIVHERNVCVFTFHYERIENEDGKVDACYWFNRDLNQRTYDLDETTLWCYPPKASAKWHPVKS